ncbi:MAG: winged helix-turn-helix domain-containing protein [Acidobacteriota bacterium]
MGVEDLKMVKFGPFELDLESEELRRDGVALTVQPQPLRVLALLISHRGKLMSREDLQRRVWGEESLHDGRDHSLNHTIRKLRLVLGDSARRPSYIQTVPRRGYRFIAKLEQEDRRPGPPEAGFSLPAEDEGGGPLRLRVLPFRDIAENGPFPPLADGAVEELVSALVRLQDRGLFVIDGPSQPPPDGRDFRLRGAVRATGGHVRVHAYLVRSRDDRVVGTAVFEERFDDLFDLQRSIAERIVAALVEPMLDRTIAG